MADRRLVSRGVLRGATVVVALAFAIGIAEAVLRAALGSRFVSAPPARRVEDVIGRFDPDLGWTLAPSAKAHVQGDGFAYDVELNTRGFRDPERGARREGTPRVILLGDSYGFGWGVSADATLAARLEHDPRVAAEVVNLSVPGYSTDQELWMLEREGQRLAPDVVFVLFCPNDADGNATTNAHRMLKPQFVRGGSGAWMLVNRPVAELLPVGAALDPSLGDRMATHSAIWQLATGRAHLGCAPGPAAPESFAHRTYEEISAGFSAVSPTRHAFELLVAETRKLHAPLVVATVPTLGEPEESRAGADALYATTRAVAMLGAELGFETISIDRPLRDAWRAGRTLSLPDGHWNAEANAVAAEAVAPRLASVVGAARKRR